MWLTGGPGCSSVLALLSENGPCSVAADGKSTVANPYSWNANATVIWLDQPAGVGFSYGTENDKNEDMVRMRFHLLFHVARDVLSASGCGPEAISTAYRAHTHTRPHTATPSCCLPHHNTVHTLQTAQVGEDAFFFLQSLFAAHPEYASGGQEFFVFGESFGGHYAPGVAHMILTKNNEGGYPLKINLAGLGLGNGLTDPVTQYQYYPEMAMNNSYGIKTVSEDTYASMVEHVPDCVALGETCNNGGTEQQCKLAQTLCGAWETSPYYATGLNPYDIRIPCEVPGLCYNFSMVDIWLTDPAVLSALHVRSESATWESCNYDVNGDFGSDWMKGYQVSWW